MAGASTVKELAECFRIYDSCLVHLIYLDAIKTYIEKGGRSRGSFLVTDEEKNRLTERLVSGWELDYCRYDRDVEKKILEVRYNMGKIYYNLVKIREIPEQNLWFEKVWKDYSEDNFIEG